MNAQKQIIANLLVILCIQSIHCVILALYDLSNTGVYVEISIIFLFFIIFSLPCFFGTLISILILPKIFQVIIVQIIFIVAYYFCRIYMKNNNIDFILYYIQWTFIANVVSILPVLLIKFAYEAYIECIYKRQEKKG